MGVVSKYILNLIAKQVEDNGIVDWYDPDRAYSEAVKALDLAGSTILRYDGSFAQLRWEIDQQKLMDGHPSPSLGPDTHGRPAAAEIRIPILGHVPCYFDKV
jgi:hypothetical protein